MRSHRPTAPESTNACSTGRFARASREKYEVIVSDNFHPARSGSGSLYAVEHFRTIQARLDDGGLFCQWLPLHRLDLDTLRIIIHTFLAVFPNGAAMLATNSLETPVLGLVARGNGQPFDGADLRARMKDEALAASAAASGLPDALAVFGSFVAGPDGLRRFAGDAPLNTDDRPIVTYRAPHVTYAPEPLPRDRLVMFLHTVAVDDDDSPVATDDAALSRRIAAPGITTVAIADPRDPV